MSDVTTENRFVPGVIVRRSRFLAKEEKTILWDTQLMGGGSLIRCVKKTDVGMILVISSGTVLVLIEDYVGWAYEYEFEKLCE